MGGWFTSFPEFAVLEGLGCSMDCWENSGAPSKSPFRDGTLGEDFSASVGRPNILLNCTRRRMSSREHHSNPKVRRNDNLNSLGLPYKYHSPIFPPSHSISQVPFHLSFRSSLLDTFFSIPLSLPLIIPARVSLRDLSLNVNLKSAPQLVETPPPPPQC